MGNTHARLVAHVIYSTKDRLPHILPAEAPRLYSYIGGIIHNRQSVLLAAGGIEDHAHLLVSYHQTIAPANLVRDIKSNSSRWCREELGWKEFGWQTGYGIFAVSKSNEEKVKAYIANQREHHHGKTFKEEYIGFLEAHEVDYDPDHVWD